MEEGDIEQEVLLYVYDLSGGLARSLSSALLGRQIDGVWHTGIVVFGEEFYFGGMAGIASCLPGGTILGQPTEIIPLGKTQLTYDIFMSYLHELSQTSFRSVCYHLFNHNCNSFSNEIANFLTGHSIPEKISSLPQDILQTPFGAMIKPFIDAMSGGPEGGHALFTANDSLPVLAAAERSNVGCVISSPSVTAPQPVTYNNTQVIEMYNQHSQSLKGFLHPVDFQLICEVHEFLLVTGEHDWSLGPPHIRTLCRLIADNNLPSTGRVLLTDVLAVSLLSHDVVTACINDPCESFVALVNAVDTLTMTSQQHSAVGKCICNCVSTKSGAQWLISKHSRQQPSASPQLLLTVVCHQYLLDTSCQDSRLIGAHIVSNVLQSIQTLTSDVALELGVTLIEACKLADVESAHFVWYALYVCIQSNPELGQLVAVMDLDISEQQTKYPNINQYTAAIGQLMQLSP